MRIIGKLLYMICGALAFVIIFIAFCSQNPEITKQMGKMFSKEGSVGNENSASEEYVTATATRNDQPAAEASASDNEGEENLNIPSNVAQLTGYIPVQPSGATVTQAKADEIASSLSKGETGEGLAFDEEFYPYYAMLNDAQKAIYRQIYANANAMIKNFAPAETIMSSDLKNAFTAVVNDHPELFWVDTSYKYQYAPTGQIADIALEFNVTANNIDAAKSEFEAAAKAITDQTYGHYTDYEKEKIAHDALIGKVKYDLNAPMNQSAYSALVYGRTVCAGYARAFQYILQQLKIPCYYVTGYAGQNHAWNIVKLDDGQYYNVDSTWDDTDPNTYDYFNCSDADYASNHVRKDLSVYLPPCNGSRYSGLEANPQPQPQPPSSSDGTNGNTAQKPQTGTAQTTTTTTTTTTTPAPTTPQSTAPDQNVPNNADKITVQTVRGSDKGDIKTIEKYYNACFAAMMAAASDNISFDIIVYNKNLKNEIYRAYKNGSCQKGYIDRYLVEKHQNKCTVSLTAIEQSNGSWLLKHEAVVE